MSGPGAKLRWARKARTRCRILDGGDDAQPAATAGPGEDSEIERTVHQRRPGPGVSGDGGVGLAREGGSVWGGAAVADHVDMGELRTHLVLTHPAHGLRPADALLSIATLMRPIR
jgi:hypothetical protein